MNVSYRWLRDMVPGLELEPEALAEHLALRGALVEDMSSPGAELGDIVVGLVIEAGQHPNADRLSLCTVDGGAGHVQVVCGAPNVKTGSWYPFAPLGAVLPGNFKIKKSKIRGEASQGMLCSAKELGLGVDHDGILEIHGDFTAGESFVEAIKLDDATLDVEITANRGDLLSHAGVARELASEGEGRVVLPEIEGDPGVELSFERGSPEARRGPVGIRIDDADLCSRYLGAVIRGVKIGPSPEWLQQRLRGAGARPINNVVDATNYVMLELGQPLHAFDLNGLAGTSIVVRRVRPDEKSFTTLDGEKRELSADMLLICDAERAVAIAGVMGGLDSEVEQDTVDVLLECALFDPKSIRATRRELIMSTDASYRFERGVDPEGMELAVARAVALILATAGGVVDGPVLDCCCEAFEPLTVDLRLSRIEHLLGVRFEADRVRELLSPLGFETVDESDGTLHVRVPGFRSYDVRREVDLIEEVARAHGYDNFPSDLGPYRPGTVVDHPLFALEDELRRSLAARGLLEAQTPAFVREGEGDVRVANPLATTEPFIRRAILPSLVRRLEYNFSHGNHDVRLFEIGTSFRSAAPGEPPLEETHVAAVLHGRREPQHWSSNDAAIAIWDLKALLKSIASTAYGAGAAVVPVSSDTVPSASDAAAVGASPLAEGPFAEGLAFDIVLADGSVAGSGGRLTLKAVDAPAWAGEIWGLEVKLPSDPIPADPVTFEPLPQFPAAERDLALLVPDRVSAYDVATLIRARGGVLLESVELFDLYRGEGVEEGKRSLAYRLRFRSPDRTLKDKQVDKAVSAILARIKEELSVEHRG